MELQYKYWMVMASITYDGRSNNRSTCFELNAINLNTEQEAIEEAARRNEVEALAGHTNVHWYPTKQFIIPGIPEAPTYRPKSKRI